MTHTSWQAEVSNKQYFVMFHPILKIITICIFYFFIDQFYVGSAAFTGKSFDDSRSPGKIYLSAGRPPKW
jgi:hypothetical protein